MDGKEGAIRDGDVNLQNCFLKTVQKSSESVHSEECAGRLKRQESSQIFILYSQSGC